MKYGIYSCLHHICNEELVCSSLSRLTIACFGIIQCMNKYNKVSNKHIVMLEGH